MRTLLLALLITAALSGCLSTEDVQDSGASPPAGTSDPGPGASVVVAVIDSGANPYHEAFQRPSLSGMELARYTNDGVAPRVVELTRSFETFEENYEADEAIWDSIQPGELIYFAGTNLLGISFSGGIPILDDPGSAHGTGTSGAVTYANPNATVVLVEGTNTESELWASEQEWIDIVSMSYGPPGSVPIAGGPALGLSTARQTEAMWNLGQIPVGAADNTPSLAINDETAGPPWVIGVAGDHPEEDARCREHISGTFPDITADFTQDLPLSNSMNGTNFDYSGTSFSTPRAAGTISAILQNVRAEWGHEGGIVDGALAISPDGERLTNELLRDGLFRAAYYFDFGDCPVQPGTELPVNPAAPWLQMGWGHVGPDVVDEVTLHLIGEEILPERDADVTAFQDAMMAYRALVWGTLDASSPI